MTFFPGHPLQIVTIAHTGRAKQKRMVEVDDETVYSMEKVIG